MRGQLFFQPRLAVPFQSPNAKRRAKPRELKAETAGRGLPLPEEGPRRCVRRPHRRFDLRSGSWRRRRRPFDRFGRDTSTERPNWRKAFACFFCSSGLRGLPSKKSTVHSTMCLNVANTSRRKATWYRWMYLKEMRESILTPTTTRNKRSQRTIKPHNPSHGNKTR